jgi:hypothetical protein
VAALHENRADKRKGRPKVIANGPTKIIGAFATLSASLLTCSDSMIKALQRGNQNWF